MRLEILILCFSYFNVTAKKLKVLINSSHGKVHAYSGHRTVSFMMEHS